ncbi:hypothetical protein [Arthrobacter sp. ISL-30]|uniref:hypothetical protein n=1 Tax=Arthrobacter sp. ISL-30 TaxID=2819109 RepID=UPI0027E1A9FF|nr:hypothetical protein [Arthrobacter sp. ISL-30]
MLTLQPRQRVGHDILLARHGNHISQMRLDRENDRVIALLDDGSVDTAPNRISPLLEMPETFRSLLCNDWRSILLAGAVMLTVGLVAMVIAMGMMGGLGEAELHQIAISYPAY